MPLGKDNKDESTISIIYAYWYIETLVCTSKIYWCRNTVRVDVTRPVVMFGHVTFNKYTMEWDIFNSALSEWLISNSKNSILHIKWLKSIAPSSLNYHSFPALCIPSYLKLNPSADLSKRTLLVIISQPTSTPHPTMPLHLILFLQTHVYGPFSGTGIL